MIDSVPSRAPTSPPLTGASSVATPRCGELDRRPSGGSSTCRSTARATPATIVVGDREHGGRVRQHRDHDVGGAGDLAQRRGRPRARDRLRRAVEHRHVEARARTRLRAIGSPITPSPMKPIIAPPASPASRTVARVGLYSSPTQPVVAELVDLRQQVAVSRSRPCPAPRALGRPRSGCGRSDRGARRSSATGSPPCAACGRRRTARGRWGARYCAQKLQLSCVFGSRYGPFSNVLTASMRIVLPGRSAATRRTFSRARSRTPKPTSALSRGQPIASASANATGMFASSSAARAGLRTARGRPRACRRRRS